MNKPHAHAVRTLTFEVQLDDQQRAAASGPIPVVVSTDAPVEMPDGVEILVHDADAVDLCRAPLPIIASHRGGAASRNPRSRSSVSMMAASRPKKIPASSASSGRRPR